MAKEPRVIRIHGKVQSVGYRFFATRVARRLVGAVLADGPVDRLFMALFGGLIRSKAMP